MIKKIIGRRKLADLPVTAVDKSRTSHRYFQVTEFPRKFTAGKNIIKLRAKGNVLVPNSVIHTEILDAQNNPIYHEILNYVESDGTRVIVVYIYPDTPPGIATVYIAGRASRIRELRTGKIPFSENPASDNYKDNPNIKWLRTIPVQPSVENTSEILFLSASGESTSYPIVQISEMTIPYLDTVHPSGSQFQTKLGTATHKFELKASPTTILQVPSSAAVQGQGGAGQPIPFIQSPFGKGVLKYGLFNRIPVNSLSPAIDVAPGAPFIATASNSAQNANKVMQSQAPLELPGIELPQIHSTGFLFEPDMVGGKIQVNSPIVIKTPHGTTQISSSYEAVIVKLQTDKIANVTKTLNHSYTNPAGVVSKIHGFQPSTNWTASYSQKPIFVTTQNSQSYANIVVSNLMPASGDISKIRVYQRAAGSTGNYKLVNETDVEQQDLLVDDNSITTTTGMGIINHQTTANKYWGRAGFNGAGTPTLIADRSHLMESMKILPHANGFPNNNSYHTIRLNDEYARTIYKGAPYYVEFDAKSFINSNTQTGIISNPRIDIYMSGSAFNAPRSFATDAPTYFIKDRALGKHIGTIEGGSGSRFDNIQAHFEPDNTGTGVPIFVVRSGNWHLSEIHLYPNRLEGFSPAVTRILIPVAIEHMNSAQEFKLKYYNAAGKASKHESVLSGLVFSGANVYIQGGSNLLSGSIFIGNSVGSGIELAGVNSGFIRSMGYEGFDHAKAGTGGPGFLIYSGSVLPNSGTDYEGVGLELIQDNDSYLRYRTNDGAGNAELDIRTKKFFLGSEDSFISGSGDGTIAISSSFFELSSGGSVTMQGTITATAGGTIGGFDIGADTLSTGTGANFIAIDSANKKLRIGAKASLTDSNTGVHVSTDGIALGASSAFKVTNVGALSANNVDIVGKISANRGDIGGFAINAATISSSNNNLILRDTGEITGSKVLFTGGKIADFTIDGTKLKQGTAFHLDGAPDTDYFISSSAFQVTPAGDVSGSKVLFTGGKIGDWNLSTTLSATNILLDPTTPKITLGSKSTLTDTSTGLYLGTDGLALGASSVFKVTNTGVLTATDANITGTITANAGAIGGFGINATTISSSNNNLILKSDGQITGSTVLFDGGKIAGWDIDADRITKANGTTKLELKADITPGLWLYKESDTSHGVFIGTQYYEGGSQGFGLSYTSNYDNPNHKPEFTIGSGSYGNQIAGWTFDNTKLFNDGVVISASYGFKVTDGTEDGNDYVDMANRNGSWGIKGRASGTDIFELGSTNQIAGWTFDDEKLVGGNMIIKKSGTIVSDGFASNVAGSGFILSAVSGGMLEVENARIRGTLSTAVFEKETVNAVGGQLYVANSTTLTGSLANPGAYYSATDTTMSVVNASGFTVGEILTAKKINSTGFATEYLYINSASRTDQNSDIDMSGKIYVTRGFGAGINQTGSLVGDLASVAQTYSGSQVIVSTGKIGTGYIRLNANPNDITTPYIDLAERHGVGIYDVALKARIGDLSGVEDNRFSDGVTGYGLYTDNGYFKGKIEVAGGDFAARPRTDYKIAYIDSGSSGTTGFPHNEGYVMGGFLSASLGYVGGNYGTTSIQSNVWTTPNAVPGNTWFSVVTGSTTPSDITGYSETGYDLFVHGARGYGPNTVTEWGKILNLFDEGNSVLAWGNNTTGANVTGSGGTECPVKAYQSMTYGGVDVGSESGSYATSSAVPSTSPLHFTSGSTSTNLLTSNPILQGWGPEWIKAYATTGGERANPATRLYSDGGGTTVVPIAARNIAADGDLRHNTTAQYLAWYMTNPRGGRMVMINGPFDPQNLYNDNPVASNRIIDFLLKKDMAQESYQQGLTTITGDMISTGKIQSTNFSIDVGSEFNLNDGTFKMGGSVAPSLHFDGSNLTVSGAISASAGKLAGFDINGSKLKQGDTFYLDGDFDASYFISSSNFQVTPTGDVSGSKVLFTGGKIADFTIDGTKLKQGSAFHLDGASDADFFISSSDFQVTPAGQITGSSALLTGGKIGGWTIGSTLSATNILLDPATPKITLGDKATLTDSNTGLYLGTDGLALGADSVFKVTNTGTLTATDANVTGRLTVGYGHYAIPGQNLAPLVWRYHPKSMGAITSDKYENMTINGTAAENAIDLGIGPFGNKELLWQTWPHLPNIVDCLNGTIDGDGVTVNLIDKVTFVADAGTDYLKDIAVITSSRYYRCQADVTGITGGNSLGFGEPFSDHLGMGNVVGDAKIAAQDAVDNNGGNATIDFTFQATANGLAQIYASNDTVFSNIQVKRINVGNGGWNSVGIPIDSGSAYMYVCYIKRREDTNGSAYWGTRGTSDAGGNNGLINNTTSGYPDVVGNPYFQVGDVVPANESSADAIDRWFLHVGYVYPSGSAIDTLRKSVVYDLTTGLTGSYSAPYDNNSFIWNTGVETTNHRGYHYYNNVIDDGTTLTSEFARPGIYKMDGSEPTIQQLLSNTSQGGNTVIDGATITTGKIQSNNWSATEGSKLDLDAGTIELGGSTSPAFAVNTQGALTASGATITGDVTITNPLDFAPPSASVTGRSLFMNVELTSSGNYSGSGVSGLNTTGSLQSTNFGTPGFPGLIGQQWGVATRPHASDLFSRFGGPVIQYHNGNGIGYGTQPFLAFKNPGNSAHDTAANGGGSGAYGDYGNWGHKIYMKEGLPRGEGWTATIDIETTTSWTTMMFGLGDLTTPPVSSGEKTYYDLSGPDSSRAGLAYSVYMSGHRTYSGSYGISTMYRDDTGTHRGNPRNYGGTGGTSNDIHSAGTVPAFHLANIEAMGGPNTAAAVGGSPGPGGLHSDDSGSFGMYSFAHMYADGKLAGKRRNEGAVFGNANPFGDTYDVDSDHHYTGTDNTTGEFFPKRNNWRFVFTVHSGSGCTITTYSNGDYTTPFATFHTNQGRDKVLTPCFYPYRPDFGLQSSSNPYYKVTGISVGQGLPTPGTKISGEMISTGKIQSNNWGSFKGTELDLNNEKLTFGGINVGAATKGSNGGDSNMKFFKSGSANYVLRIDDNLLGEHPGIEIPAGTIRIVNTQDFGEAGSGAPLFVASQNAPLGSNRCGAYFGITGQNTLPFKWTATGVTGRMSRFESGGSTCPTIAIAEQRAYHAGVVAESSRGFCPLNASTSDRTIVAAYLAFGNTGNSEQGYSFYGADGIMHNNQEIRSNADVIAYHSSDLRMKDNIFRIENPIDKIKRLRGVEFDWNEHGPSWTIEGFGIDGKHDIGVIAQEVQKVIPSAVTERDNGMLGVKYEKLIPLLLEGIKEQQNMIESLEARIKKLENK